jgi:hypothetical protein
MTEIQTQEAECARLLELAHDAPLKAYRLDHDGHRWVEGPDTAFKTGRAWMDACDKLDRMKIEYFSASAASGVPA